MAKPNDRILEIQDRVRTRSQDSRRRYLDDIAAMTDSPDSDRRQVSCSNMAHAAAGAGAGLGLGAGAGAIAISSAMASILAH